MKRHSINLKTISSLFSSLRILKSANQILPYANQPERQTIMKLISEDVILGSPNFLEELNWIRGAEHELGETFRVCFRNLMSELETEAIQLKNQLRSQPQGDAAELIFRHS